MSVADQILQLAVKANDPRLWMGQPNEAGGYVYSTDGHWLIRVKKDLPEQKYPAHPSVANFTPVMESINIHAPLNITMQQLLTALSKIQKVATTKVCAECRGEGTVECNLGHQHACDDCKGDGFVEDYSKPDHYPITGAVKFKDDFIAPFYLDGLRQVLELQGLTECECIGGMNNPLKSKFFKAGIAEVLVMPKRYDDDEEADEIYDFETGQKIPSKI